MCNQLFVQRCRRYVVKGARVSNDLLTDAEQGGEGPKGSGKKKGKTVPLTDFLKPASMGNWADDDVDDSRKWPSWRPQLQLRTCAR